MGSDEAQLVLKAAMRLEDKCSSRRRRIANEKPPGKPITVARVGVTTLTTPHPRL